MFSCVSVQNKSCLFFFKEELVGCKADNGLEDGDRESGAIFCRFFRSLMVMVLRVDMEGTEEIQGQLTFVNLVAARSEGKRHRRDIQVSGTGADSQLRKFSQQMDLSLDSRNTGDRCYTGGEGATLLNQKWGPREHSRASGGD